MPHEKAIRGLPGWPVLAVLLLIPFYAMLALIRAAQASAVVAARQKIVEGAVGMVEMALEELGRRRVVELDEERKAAMVSNLLVVLCSERGVEPVVNTGTLYQ